MTATPEKRPLYPTLLQLKNVHPNAWQRAVLGEGMVVLGILLVMADLASGWAIVVLPLAMAGVVKVHDVMAGILADEPAQARPVDTELDTELDDVRAELEAVRRELADLLSAARSEPARD